jgi:hypothetical protein
MERLLLLAQEKNPLDISDLKQCDPYSSFGVFCNANSFVEGIVIIIGVALLFVASMWFVKKNQENVQRERESKNNDA